MTAKGIEGTTGLNDMWHYAVGSDRKGPVPRPTLAKLLASGEISAETYVWQPGMDNWVHLGDAAPLKPLVAGLEGDGMPEDFVEEDTAFTSPEELKLSHHQLDREDEPLSTDTIVEPLPVQTMQMGSKAAKPAAPAPAPAPVVAPDVDDLFGSAAATSSATGSDIFSAAQPSAGSSGSDIFASDSPAAEDENIAGVHGRRQSSVLFSLDELGREEGGKKPSGGMSEAFVTDSSGLIDIKAVATSAKPSVGDDPFVSGAGLQMPPRPTSPGAMSVPLVGRKRSLGPWILGGVAVAAAAVALVIVLTSGKNNPPPVAANDRPPAAQVPKETPAPADPGAAKVAAAPEKDPKATAPTPEVKDPKVAEAGNPAGTNPAGTNPATPETNPAGANPAGTNPAGANPAGANPAGANPAGTNPTDKKPGDHKKPEDKTKPAETDKPKPPEVVVAVEPKVETKPKNNEQNTANVNNLLNKLNGGKDDGKVTDTGDTGLPEKLSAAVVRNTIKGKFGGCGSMVTTGGPVSVMTSFVIAGSGVVQSARITDAAGVGGDVQKCVVGVIKGTTFGKFKEATMTVNLPVKLL